MAIFQNLDEFIFYNQGIEIVPTVVGYAAAYATEVQQTMLVQGAAVFVDGKVLTGNDLVRYAQDDLAVMPHLQSDVYEGTNDYSSDADILVNDGNLIDPGILDIAFSGAFMTPWGYVMNFDSNQPLWDGIWL